MSRFLHSREVCSCHTFLVYNIEPSRVALKMDQLGTDMGSIRERKREEIKIPLSSTLSAVQNPGDRRQTE